jgi:hypothetical protein
MAAINLVGANVSPWNYTHTFSGGNVWQEFTLPGWATRVVIITEGVSGFVASKGSGPANAPVPPVDGGAVGAHRIVIPANTAFEWVRGPINNEPMVFVALSAAGSCTIHIEPA